MEKILKKTLIKIGENIRDLRISQKLSQEELGEIASLHRTYIGAVERGERNISVKTLIKIAIALDTTIDKLVY